MTAVILGGCIVLAAGIVSVVSRHKKSGIDAVRLIGSAGVVHTALDPDGTVLIEAELWSACSTNGEELPPGSKVKTVGTRNHLLLLRLQDQ